MDIGTYMAGLAKRIEQSLDDLGLAGVSYPPLNAVPESPWVMIRPSQHIQGRVSKERAGKQVVRPAIDLVVLVASDVTRPADASRLDGLLHPLLDLFDANANGGNVNHAFTGILTESVDRVWHDVPIIRTPIDWGETGYCHALILTLDSEFQRKAALI